MCFTVLRSARSSVAPLGQRGREGVSIPPPYPLWTPYPPLNDQGMSPWTQKRKVAPGVWLKKLFTAHQMYCASLFPGAIRPALRLCMRALRARLPNVPNEINDFNGFTVPPETHEINDFNEITIPRPPNGITKATKPTKTTKCLFCGHFVFFVVYGEIVISLQPLAPTQKSPSEVGRGCRLTCFCTSLRSTSGSCRW